MYIKFLENIYSICYAGAYFGVWVWNALVCLLVCRDLFARKCHPMQVIDLMFSDQKTTIGGGKIQMQSVCKEMLGLGVNYVKYLYQLHKVFSLE